MKRISIISPCFNEVENVEALKNEVALVFSSIPDYNYEHIFIDNCSMDGTQTRLRALAAEDSNVKVIFNERNFGFSKSSFYGMMQGTGDCVIFLMADLQDPPSLIFDMLKKWENGAAIVTCIKTTSSENVVMYYVRSLYYRLMSYMTDGNHIAHFTGFGLYDKKFIDLMKKSGDSDPYLRGLVSQYGFRIEKIEYHQNKRQAGYSKFRFLDLVNLALLGLISSSRMPLRFLIVSGFILSVISFVVGMLYLVTKLIYWQSFQDGVAGISAAIFFIGSIQLLFLGIIGEYVGSTHEEVRNRPLVIERERINF